MLIVLFFLPSYNVTRAESEHMTLSNFDVSLGADLRFSEEEKDLKRADLEIKPVAYALLVISFFSMIFGGAYPPIGICLALFNSAVAVYMKNQAVAYVGEKLGSKAVCETSLLFMIYIITCLAIILLLAVQLIAYFGFFNRQTTADLEN